MKKEIILSPINCIYEFPYGDLVVGTTESLRMFRDREEISSTPHETGIETISGKGDIAVCIDGLGRAHILDAKGLQMTIQETSSGTFMQGGPKNRFGDRICKVATYSHSGEDLGKTNERGDVGERITAIGWNSNSLVVAREGHGLVPGEEEALEVESWNEGQLEKRFDVNRRIVSIEGDWMGLDMGVMYQGNIVGD